MESNYRPRGEICNAYGRLRADRLWRTPVNKKKKDNRMETGRTHEQAIHRRESLSDQNPMERCLTQCCQGNGTREILDEGWEFECRWAPAEHVARKLKMLHLQETLSEAERAL